MLRKDRPTRGGGVAILIRKDFHFSRMPDINGVEALWCKLLLGGLSLFIGAVYRPVGSIDECMHSLHGYMQSTIKEDDKIILAGDFNLPTVNWTTTLQPEGSDGKSANVLFDLMFNFNLVQTVTSPTRVHG